MFASRATVRIGRILGHDIALDLISFGIIVLLVWTNNRQEPQFAVAWLVAIFLMVLIHELGHAVSIRRLTGEYTLIIIGWGGLTVSYGRKRPRDQLLVSLAGPAAGFAAGLVAWCLAMWIDPGHPGWPPWPGDWFLGSIWRVFLYLFVQVCLFWSAFNLIPAIPLDGGKALRAALALGGMYVFKLRRYTRWLSLGIAIAGGVWIKVADLDRFFYFIVLIVALAVIDEARTEGW